MAGSPGDSAGTGSHSLQTITVLRVLRVSLHLMFACLLLVGTLAALVSVEPAGRRGLALLLSGLLGLIYLWGTVYEKRRGLPLHLSQVIPVAGPPGRHEPGREPYLPVVPWLTAVTGCWLLLMLISSSFTWLVFPLMFLYLHLLPPARGLLATALLCALAVALPLVGPAGFGLEALRTGGIAPGFFIGPTLGALLAIVVSFTYRALSADAARQFRLAAELRAVQEQLVAEQYTAGQLEERERLAREIHDTLAQGLSSIVLLCRAARTSLVDGNRGQAANQLALIESSAAENLAEARRFIKDLSSPTLGDSPLRALARLAERVQSTQRALGGRAESFTCTFTFEGSQSQAEKLPEAVSTTLLRCAQGALANVLTHSRATASAMTLTLWPEEVTLDIVDNGVGFGRVQRPSPLEEPAVAGTGFGLISLRKRVAALGGSLEVESGADGTVLTVSLPLGQKEGL